MATLQITNDLEAAFASERGRLVRLSARLSGDADAAEDLAQETLVEAWRHLGALRDVEKRAEWLAGIARNVCRRWLRARGREHGRLLRPAPGAEPLNLDERLAGDFDLELELERDELAALLDRALALLPIETRAVLIERYVRDAPHAAIAARLGLSEGAVKMRLQRGKLSLRRLLMTDLRDEAAAYGFAGADEWQETRIWCPSCGMQQLLGQFSRGDHDGAFVLRCPACCPEDGSGVCLVRALFADFPHVPALLKGVKGFKAALSRDMEHTYTYYQQALAGGRAPCMRCGHVTALRLTPPPQLQWLGLRGVHLVCDRCGCVPDEPLRNLVLTLPEGRRFWRDHPRIRALPERALEAAGRPALLVSFESVRDTARFDAVVDRETYRVIAETSPRHPLRA